MFLLGFPSYLGRTNEGKRVLARQIFGRCICWGKGGCGRRFGLGRRFLRFLGGGGQNQRSRSRIRPVRKNGGQGSGLLRSFDRIRSAMRLGRFIGPVVRGGACRSPGPTRNSHVERGRPGRGGKAKTQKTRWTARKLGEAKSRREGRTETRIEAMVEVKEQAPEDKVGHREGVGSRRFNADEWK